MADSDTRPFQAVFFDLFNTLLHFDYSRLPEVEFQGKTFRTSTGVVYRQVRERFAVSFSYEHFLERFLQTRQIVNERVEKDYREVPCLERFELLRRLLKIDAESAAKLMVDVHMEEMFQTMYCPEETKQVLDHLNSYPLVLVSNFDYAPTARRALQAFGLEEYFQAIFISEEVGWRKPGEKLFQIALQETHFAPQNCLWVGDDPSADVYGAGRLGFQVAWLAGDGLAEPPLPPRWTIGSLSEVVGIVKYSFKAGHRAQ